MLFVPVFVGATGITFQQVSPALLSRAFNPLRFAANLQKTQAKIYLLTPDNRQQGKTFRPQVVPGRIVSHPGTLCAAATAVSGRGNSAKKRTGGVLPPGCGRASDTGTLPCLGLAPRPVLPSLVSTLLAGSPDHKTVNNAHNARALVLRATPSFLHPPNVSGRRRRVSHRGREATIRTRPPRPGVNPHPPFVSGRRRSSKAQHGLKPDRR